MPRHTEALLEFLNRQKDYWVPASKLGELACLLRPVWFLLRAKGQVPQDVDGDEEIIAACHAHDSPTLGLHLKRNGPIVEGRRSMKLEIVVDVEKWIVRRIGFDDYERVSQIRRDAKPKPPKRVSAEAIHATMGLMEPVGRTASPMPKPVPLPKQDRRKKLSPEQVREIRRLAKDRVIYATIAARFNVHRGTIHRIVVGKSRAEVE